MKYWMKLDNAAKIYPMIESDYIPSVFRYNAVFDIEIKKDVLITALNNVMVRFPYYKVTLKKGLFWYYLEENNQPLVIHEDKNVPCRRIIGNDNNGYLFRILYSKNSIGIEINHILADGSACLIFYSTILYEYFKLEGYDVLPNELIKDLCSEADKGEFEDSHTIIGKKYLSTHDRKIDSVRGVFHLRDRLIKRNTFNVTYTSVDAKQLSYVAKQYNASITVFLTSIYLECMLELQKEQIQKKRKRKVVAIQVPVNMRTRIASKSMRNFSLFVIPYLYPNKEYTFESIIELVNNHVKEKTDLDYLLSLMVQNIKTEKTPFVRFLPLRIKLIVAPLIYKAVGVDTFSGTISNIGRVEMPSGIEKHVKRMDFVLGPCPITKGSCSVLGFREKILITFGRTIKEARVEKKFFRKLVKLGVKVKIVD